MASQICVDAFETHMLGVITNITVCEMNFQNNQYNESIISDSDVMDGRDIPPAKGDEFDDVDDQQNPYSLLYQQQESSKLIRGMKRPSPGLDLSRAGSIASCTEDDDDYYYDDDDAKSGTKKKKMGRPKGKSSIPAPAKTVAASTNAEKRQKMKNLFRKVATVDLITDVENASADDPITKFVLIQVSTAPAPPVEGGGPHRKVVAEKVKTVTIYGGPTDDDLKTTLAHASAAISGFSPDDYKLIKVHNLKEVDAYFKQIEHERRIQRSMHG